MYGLQRGMLQFTKNVRKKELRRKSRLRSLRSSASSLYEPVAQLKDANRTSTPKKIFGMEILLECE